METKRERLWKAAVENASHSLRVYHNTLRTTAAPFGHGSLIGGGSNLENVHAYNQFKAYSNTLFGSPTMTNNVYLDALSRSPNHHQRTTRHGAIAASRKRKAHCNDLQGREVFSR